MFSAMARSVAAVPATDPGRSASEVPSEMGHIAIKLTPASLVNPDLHIRYRIPELIVDATKGRIRDDGYDYQNGDTLIVFLSCDDPPSDVEDVLAALAANTVCDNCVLDSAVVGISDDQTTFKIVHPATNVGKFAVSPW